MKCATHDADAVAVCAYCGRALCAACERAPSPRTACSSACAAALARSDRAVDLTLAKSVQMARVSAYGCWLMGVLFIAFALWGHHVYPQMRVAHPMLGALGFGMLLFGFWYYRVASKAQ